MVIFFRLLKRSSRIYVWLIFLNMFDIYVWLNDPILSNTAIKKKKHDTNLLSWTIIRTNTTEGIAIGAVVPHEKVRRQLLANYWFTSRLSPPTTLGTTFFQDPTNRVVSIFHSVARFAPEFTGHAWWECPLAVDAVALGKWYAVVWYLRVRTGHNAEGALCRPFSVLFARDTAFAPAHFGSRCTPQRALLAERETLWTI